MVNNTSEYIKQCEPNGCSQKERQLNIFRQTMSVIGERLTIVRQYLESVGSPHYVLNYVLNRDKIDSCIDGLSGIDLRGVTDEYGSL